MDETYLTAQQVADLLQVSAKSVQRWALADPSMPVLRIGQTLRFPRERLLTWLRSREQGRPGARHRSGDPVSPPAVPGA